jgi:glycosyltransferase involved in cell wall biosynthesis
VSHIVFEPEVARGSAVLPRLSVVIPAKNEADSIASQLAELETVLAPLAPFEVVYVVDGSTDESVAELARAARPWLRVFRHDESCGKSAALLTGVRAARGAVIATLDGDGQNDPKYVLELVAALDAGGPRVALAAGQRARRGDGPFKKLQSRIANAVRAAVLKDRTRDTACGHKVFRREVFLALPFFDAW